MYMMVHVGEDFNIIQQEIHILSECKHQNIVGYLGSYLRLVVLNTCTCIHVLYVFMDVCAACLYFAWYESPETVLSVNQSVSGTRNITHESSIMYRNSNF